MYDLQMGRRGIIGSRPSTHPLWVPIITSPRSLFAAISAILRLLRNIQICLLCRLAVSVVFWVEFTILKLACSYCSRLSLIWPSLE